MKTASGMLPRGAEYLVEVPDEWNGTVFLYCHGRVNNSDAPNTSARQLRDWLFGQGFAVAGSCYRPESEVKFWQLEEAFEDQEALLNDLPFLTGGTPDVVVAWGHSIGGLITAGLVQTMGDRLAGALPWCGPVAGSIPTLNMELDCAYVFNTLVAGTNPLDVVSIQRPDENLRRSLAILEEAQSNPVGRARIALAAAMTNAGAWADPNAAAPADPGTTQQNHYRWFAGIGFSVYFWARTHVEQRAGGNPSWNIGVDYSDLLARSVHRLEVEALYAEAGASLETDLSTLAEAPRVDADADAVAYLRRYIAFDGRIDIPVLMVHTTGDGLCGTSHTRAYRDAVDRAGRGDQLRQLYTGRGGHCSFTVGETVVAFRTLLDRIRTGRWADDLAPATLNETAAAMGGSYQELTGYGPPSTGSDVAPNFVTHDAPEFFRPFDLAPRSQSTPA